MTSVKPTNSFASSFTPISIDPFKVYPSLVTGFFFNNTFWNVYVRGTVFEKADGPFSHTIAENFQISLQETKLELNPDGAYTITQGSLTDSQAEAAPLLNGTYEGGPEWGQSLPGITHAFLGGKVYVFVLSKTKGSATSADTTNLAYYTVELNEANEVVFISQGILKSDIYMHGVVAMTNGDNINLAFPGEDSSILYRVFDGTTIIGDIAIPVDFNFSTAAPFSSFTVCEVDSFTNNYHLTLIDSEQKVWQITVPDGALASDNEVCQIDIAPLAPESQICLAQGPFLGMSSSISNVLFNFGGSLDPNFAYGQVPYDSNPPEVILKEFPYDGPEIFILQGFSSVGYIPFTGEDGMNNLLRITVFGFGQVGNNAANTGFQMYAFASGQLQAQSAFLTDTSATPTSEAESKAFQSAWSLLGIIQGPPPFPNNTGSTPPPNESSVTLTLSEEIGSSSSISYSNSISISVEGESEIFSASASIKHVLENSSETKQSFSVSDTEALTNGGTLPNLGLLLFNQPTIHNAPYNVFSPDGNTNLGLTVYILSVTNNAFVPVNYDITNPDGENQPYCAGMLPFPPSSNIGLGSTPNWSNPPLTSDLINDPSTLILPEITVTTDISGGQTLSESIEKTITNSMTNTVAVSAGFFGFDTDIESSVTTEAVASTEFQSNLATSINMIVTNTPPKPDDVVGVSLYAYICQLESGGGATPSLVPTLYLNSSPWLITWQVNSVSTSEVPLQDESDND